jgi:hypothetical protein
VARERFANTTSKYYTFLDKALATSVKKKEESALDELEAALDEQRKAFCVEGAQYVTQMNQFNMLKDQFLTERV